jgi:hypothetical protein
MLANWELEKSRILQDELGVTEEEVAKLAASASKAGLGSSSLGKSSLGQSTRRVSIGRASKSRAHSLVPHVLFGLWLEIHQHRPGGWPRNAYEDATLLANHRRTYMSFKCTASWLTSRNSTASDFAKRPLDCAGPLSRQSRTTL